MISGGDQPGQHRKGIRFERVVTVGNLISTGAIIVASVSGVIGIYSSIKADIAAVERRIDAQNIRLSLVERQATDNASAIAQDRTEAKAFGVEMRVSLREIQEQLGKLREDLARVGVVKSR